MGNLGLLPQGTLGLPPLRRRNVPTAGNSTQALVRLQNVSNILATVNMPSMQKRTVNLWGDIWLQSTPLRRITSLLACSLQTDTGSEEWMSTRMGCGAGLMAPTLTTQTGWKASLMV